MNGGLSLSPTTSDKIETIILKLSSKEAEQQAKREHCGQIVDSIKEFQDKINALREKVRQTQEELHVLDDDIEDLQKQRDRFMSGMDLDDDNSQSSSHYPSNMTQSQWEVKEEVKVNAHEPLHKRSGVAVEKDYSYDEDVDYRDVEDHYADYDEHEPHHTDQPEPGDYDEDVDGTSNSNTNSNSNGMNANNTNPYANNMNTNGGGGGGTSSTSASGRMKGSTLDHYFGLTPPQPPQEPQNHQATSSSSSIFPPNLQQHFSSSSANTNTNQYQGRGFQTNASRRPTGNQDYKKHFASDNFPWSKFVLHELVHTFKIQQFRDFQKEIINCTMSGDDAFVIMRTGGGKSLTYQLPALLEGKSQERKISLVVSPLLSLIWDQEEQMNRFAKGSATSFTSGLGNSEQARRWDLVRDPNSGICLVFVTPERVSKSNKLRNELQKLFEQNRLGRFVIDECHCGELCICRVSPTISHSACVHVE